MNAPNEEIAVKSPAGSLHNVTRKAFEKLYKGAGFVPVDDVGTGGANGQLTPEQLVEMLKNKTNVMAALKDHGAEFSDRTGADELREQLKAVLAEKGIVAGCN